MPFIPYIREAARKHSLKPLCVINPHPTIMTLTHWREIDYRRDSLEVLISGMEDSIARLQSRLKEHSWYDGGFFLEDVEPIVGLAFIAYQNYIISSIYDRFEQIQNRNDHYKTGSTLILDKRTEIELIIAIANYYKHRDDESELRNSTKSVLEDLNLNYTSSFPPEKRAILQGLRVLSESDNLQEITNKVLQWRELLWKNDTHNIK